MTKFKTGNGFLVSAGEISILSAIFILEERKNTTSTMFLIFFRFNADFSNRLCNCKSCMRTLNKLQLHLLNFKFYPLRHEFGFMCLSYICVCTFLCNCKGYDCRGKYVHMGSHGTGVYLRGAVNFHL